MNKNIILEFSVDLAEVMLRNGAEVYRVEETMKYLLKKLVNDSGESFVTPTTIICTIGHEDVKTIVRRIKYRQINFERVSLANQISRDITQDKIDITTAMKQLENIKEKKPYPYQLKMLLAGISCAGFTLIFYGSILDIVSSFIIGVLLYGILVFLDKNQLSNFVKSVVGGFIVSYLAYFLTRINLGTNMDIIITSSIMLLVPGVTLTNSFRDILASDYLSGLTRLIEALFIAVCIAIGVIMFFILSLG